MSSSVSGPIGTGGSTWRSPSVGTAVTVRTRFTRMIGMPPRLTGLVCAAACLVGAPPVVSAQTTERPTTRAVRLAQAPALDGVVDDDPVWTRVAPVSGFVQTEPMAGEPASERTEVRIAYTADTLYFGVVLFDRDPAGITVAEARRDSPLDDTDSFQILLDTYRDRQNGFVFATTPAGLEYDGQVSNEGGGGGPGGNQRQQGGSGGGFNLNWDGSWTVRTIRTEAGWSAEFAIPFSTLRYEAGDEREWGLNFQRTIRRNNESAFWAPLPFQFGLTRVSMAGTLTGLDLPAQRTFTLVPYVLADSQQRAATGGETTWLGDVGLDVKYGLTPSLTLDATVNTDFAQVEVDEQQINLDRFNLFFPEKRPFFLENAGMFAVGSPAEAELFFSRRIGIGDDGSATPILGGARLSGRVGQLNVGVLNMQTDAVADTPGANFTVARVQREFGRSDIGAMYVGRRATGHGALDDDHHAAYAVDGRWGIGTTGLISGFVARTNTPGVASGQHAYRLEARRETQPLTLAAGYTETGPHFTPEVGFLSRHGGFRKFDTTVFSRIRPDALWQFQEIRPHTLYRAYWNHDGFQETGYWHIDSHFELRNSWEFHTGMNVTREGVVAPFEISPGVIVAPGTYDHAEAQLVFQTNEGAPVYGYVQVVAGGFFGGDRVRWSPSVRVRASDAFNAELGLTRNDITLASGSFTTTLARLRVSYSFTPRLFTQALVQYNDRAKAWSNNFRFGWLQEANTGLFLVYTDSRDLDGANDLTSRTLTPTGTDRSVIVKFSRMFDLPH